MKTRSQIIVDLLMEKDKRIKRKGFNKAILAAFAKDTEVCREDVDYLKKYLGRIPDAYLIDEENKTVIWYEVEDTHRLTNNKIYDLYHIHFALDYCFWEMEVVLIDRYGNSHDLGIFEAGAKLAYPNDSDEGRNLPTDRI